MKPGDNLSPVRGVKRFGVQNEEDLFYKKIS